MLYHFLIVICSLVITSFAMLAGQRILIGQTPWNPTFSYCDHCQQRLTWWQLIPLLGYLLQGGRCHFCHQRIHPLASCYELAVLLSFPIINNNHWHNLWLLILIMTLVFLATTDYYQQIIYVWALIGLLTVIPVTGQCWCWPLCWWKLCLIMSILFALLLFNWIRHGLGIGDIEFIIIILTCLGPLAVAWMIIAASVLVSLSTLLQRRSVPERLPFIPFLSAGLLMVLIWN